MVDERNDISLADLADGRAVFRQPRLIATKIPAVRLERVGRPTPLHRQPGQEFLDLGEHPHIAVNRTTEIDSTVVVYFAPPGLVGPLKFMATEPPNCSF